MIMDALLSRLDKVKRTGDNSAIACCPVHGDKNPSLSVTEKDGRVLVHCFSHECSVEHIVGAVGLELSDLFPPRDVDYTQPQKRHYFPAADVLKTLDHEITFLHQCASDLRRGEKLTANDYDRLLTAKQRFATAREMIGK